MVFVDQMDAASIYERYESVPSQDISWHFLNVW